VACGAQRRRRGAAVFPSFAHATEGQAGTVVTVDVDQHVGKFFEDLAVNVRHLLPLPGGMPAGFMNQEMRGSMYWTDELIHAVIVPPGDDYGC
jgi:hypothetical protein